MTPPPGFSIPPQIPNNTTSKRPPVTTIMFAATTPENTLFAYHASTLTNPNPTISPAFVEANYEILESLLKERRRQICNEDLRTKLGYFNEDYDEEREMEPRPEPSREATPTLRLRSLVVRRQRERVVGFEDAPNREGNRRGRNVEGIRPSEIEAREGLVPIPVNPYSQPSVNLVNEQALNFPFLLGAPSPIILKEGIYHRLLPIIACLHTMGLCIPQLLFRIATPSIRSPWDSDNFLHLFEGAIRMKKWLMHVACHMFTYTLKDSARIWWNSQKTGSILNYEDLKAKFQSHFSQQKKFTKTHLVVHNIKQREGESTRAFITRHTEDTLQILDLPFTYKGLMKKTYMLVEARERNKDRFSPYRGPNHGLLPSLSKSPKEILATEKTARSFEPPPKMFGSKRSQDMSKYCHFHEDYGHDTNDCRHLRIQIQEAVNSGELSYLVKGIKKERTKSSDTLRGETKVNNAPAIIEAKIFGRKVGRVHMDSGSSCEIIYEHCFEKLNPTIKATKVDLKTPLVGFSGDASWSIGEVLNFVIVRSDSSYNMLLGRTVMQWMGIVVSTIHGAIKFNTQKGIGTVLSTDEADEGTKRARKIPATNEERVLSCVNAEEKIISNADIFAWTHADMTGIPRTIMVEGKPFNTEHKLNEYSHVKLIKQNKRGLGPDRNMAACKETEELTNAGILRKVKHQTWVANPLMVKKSDGGWRMFVDFTDINKACPKDCYPLPEIDWKIESLSGFCLKCFLDAYKGYH
ncbi:reverse transcriptase domain-containing protein [Tanacetum coccineum]